MNAAGNWVLMFGHLGAPAMGLPGSALSTSISRAYLAAVLAATLLWHERRTGNWLFHISWRPDVARIRKLVTLGLPVGGQILFEGAVFGIVTVMAARLDAVSLAAHGIAVNAISTTFMVPLGISSAAAVRADAPVSGFNRRAKRQALSRTYRNRGHERYPKLINEIQYPEEEDGKLRPGRFLTSGSFVGEGTAPGLSAMLLDGPDAIASCDGMSGSPIFRVRAVGAQNFAELAGLAFVK